MNNFFIHSLRRFRYYTLLTLGFMIVSMLVFCSGCERVKQENKETFNAVVFEPNFHEIMKTHKIHLIAPASGVDPLKIAQLQSFAFLELSVPDHLITNTIPYHSNVDELRFKMLQDALYQADDSIIWTVRGGYGSARLIDHLKTLPKPSKEKIFIGFSDNTALHLFMSQQWGWKTIHGAGASALLNADHDPENFRRLASLITHPSTQMSIDHLLPLNEAAKKPSPKTLSGKLTGGTISIIQTSVGTDWEIQASGKILFLEEVGEKGYQIDRSLNHLKQAGIFKGVKAIVFGDFADQKDDLVDLALQRFSEETNIPVFKTDQFGHGKKNYPLVYNSEASILLSNLEDEHYTLKFNIRFANEL